MKLHSTPNASKKAIGGLRKEKAVILERGDRPRKKEDFKGRKGKRVAAQLHANGDGGGAYETGKDPSWNGVKASYKNCAAEENRKVTGNPKRRGKT